MDAKTFREHRKIIRSILRTLVLHSEDVVVLSQKFLVILDFICGFTFCRVLYKLVKLLTEGDVTGTRLARDSFVTFRG